MSVINWDACLDPILRNEAWALTDAACGPDSVFQEMMGSHMGLYMLTKAAGLCWVQSQEEDTKHLLLHLSGRFAARHFSWVKTYCPYIATLFAFSSFSSYLSDCLLWFTANTCIDKSRLVNTGVPWKTGMGFRAAEKKAFVVPGWACSWIYVFSGVVH